MKTEQRLIDADTLTDSLTRWLSDAEVLYNAHVYNAIKDCICEIDAMPTVDAMVLPCRMGDRVWGISNYCKGRKVRQGVVREMFFGEDMRLCICVKGVCRGEWGKNVFATKEAAGASLTMEGGAEGGKL